MRGKPKRDILGLTKRQERTIGQVSERGDIVFLGGFNYISRKISERLGGKHYPPSKYERQLAYFKGRLRKAKLLPEEDR